MAIMSSFHMINCYYKNIAAEELRKMFHGFKIDLTNKKNAFEIFTVKGQDKTKSKVILTKKQKTRMFTGDENNRNWGATDLYIRVHWSDRKVWGSGAKIRRIDTAYGLLAAFGSISWSLAGGIMSKQCDADLTAETGYKDRWQEINSDRRDGITRQNRDKTWQKEPSRGPRPKDHNSLVLLEGGRVGGTHS